MRIIAILALLLCSAATAQAGPCHRDLTEVEIAAIVDAYWQQTYGTSARQWSKKNVSIRREDCNYIYVESSGDADVSPGEWFGMTIDENGTVIGYMPGL